MNLEVSLLVRVNVDLGYVVGFLIPHVNKLMIPMYDK